MSDSDLPKGTAADEPLSFDDGVVGIDALLDPQDADLEEEDQATNEADAEPDDDIEADDVDGEDEADADDDVDADEDEDESEEPELSKSAADDAMVTLDDGSQITVAELKRNNLFQRDYTRKTQELSAERKSFQEQQQRVEQAADALREHREFLLRVYEQNAPQPPDASMLHDDPIGYMQEKDAYDRKAAEWYQMRQFSQAEQQRMQAEMAERQQHFLQEERSRMVQRIPELKDPAKLETFKADALKYGTEAYEFSPEEVMAVGDSRYLAVLKDAIAYRKLKAKAPAVKQTVQGKPKMMRGSKRVDPQTRNAREAKAKADRLRKTGSFDAGIDALMDLDL
jgi:hypothetical protein